MTKENVIKIIRHVFHYYDEQHADYNWSEFNEACGIVIDLLENNTIEEELEHLKVELIKIYQEEINNDSRWSAGVKYSCKIIDNHIAELKGYKYEPDDWDSLANAERDH